MTRRLARTVPTPRRSCSVRPSAGRGNRKATETLAERVLADLRAPRSGSARDAERRRPGQPRAATSGRRG